jgi:hypothetical protein
MKRALLLVFVFSFVAMSFAQERIPVSQELTKISETRHISQDMPRGSEPPMLNDLYIGNNVTKGSRLLGDEVEIIETVYDLQTNRSLSNRFWAWEDGTMAAVTTRGMQTGWADRGTGYNYFDGAMWGDKPNERLESMMTGWPSVAGVGAEGEIVISHRGGTANLNLLRRMTKGVGAWEELEFPGPPAGVPGLLWPRMTTSGDDNQYVHVFVLTTPVANGGVVYEEQDGALLYYRSSDYGDTWDIQALLLEGLGSDYYTRMGADDYGLAAKGNTVVMFHAGAWADMFIMKSTDNGENWEKTIIWEHPYPFFDFDNTLMDDTLYSTDNSGNIAIDDNGMVHMVWGISRVARLAASPPEPGSYSYWPFTDGIGYWNESMGQIPEADNPHHTLMPEMLEPNGMLIGWTQDVNNSGFIFDFEGTAETPFAVYRSLGISTMPTIVIKGSYIGLAYASVTETFVTTDGQFNYHHIWTRFSYDGGQTWGEFYDIQADNIFHLYDECIYPVFAQQANPDGVFQLIYQADNVPGLHLDDDHDPVINRVIHNSFTFTVGLDENPLQAVTTLNVSQNYPNPASAITNVLVELGTAADVSVEVFNMTGQKVMDIPARSLQPGNHNIIMDVSRLTTGVYFYTVNAGKEKATRKMIVN